LEDRRLAPAGAGGEALRFARAFFLRCRSFFQRLIALEPRPTADTVSGTGFILSSMRFLYAPVMEDDFERYVEEAVATLPRDLREFMSNVALVVEDEPPEGLPLLGLYQGLPLTRRGSAYAGVAPDKITIYRGPLERRSAGDPARLRAEVRRVVLHEIAHHFGISDERLVELDRY
jgi:predicted Zn-dependent protease with MMP-like domain